ncbi:glutamic acid-rich protein-like isoform X2 [Zingiber officinale]|uniref:glutamic acid-rich protein-like isoform X1 n=1 Tax=Zingiber officinale TaxID=94328 RepID=UPI001C4ADEA2|nr:glutamic acid-rich protein-like isoform X1 [Zingiber officinale]XP_042377216.1 glutamic acid-rich protein-like isoform X1 [Zingiber officinale]XP_042377217.1 glutamic acid-rich protein-like isoform X2 [Zingiber officinale]
MEECKPSSDAEETLVENGSASPREDKIRGTFDSQNKGTTNISEEIPILEGSVPPEHENFLPDSGSKKNEDESKEKEEAEEKKHIEVNSVEKETDHEESKEVVLDRGDKGNEDDSDKKEVDDEKKHTEETAVAKEMDNEESKEGEKIEASDTMEEENKIEETNEENMIEATSAVSKEIDLEQTKDDKETRDTNVSTEDAKTVDEEGDKGEEGETTDMVKPNDIKELKEDKMTDVASTVKSEDVKVADVEGDKVMPLEYVKMVETHVGESEEGIEEKGVEQEPQGGENDTDSGKNGSIEKKDEDKKVVWFKRKRSQMQKTKSKGGDSMQKAKELLNSPITSSMERPVRERKTVERLVEVIEKERSKEFQVEKGRGTPLKDIPSVAHKLARKKPADIKLIHQTLFGRRGKAVNFKNHILQFSGFVWHESDEKQRAKMKEKLDKYVKDTLLDLCDLFDLPASKANSRKEELVEKLLDFLVAPHPNTEQSTKPRKRKRPSKGSLSKGSEDNHSKRSRKKQIRDEASLSEEDKSAPETDDEDDVNTGSPHKGKAVEHSESEDEEDAADEVSEEDEPEKEDIGKDNKDKKKVPRQRDSVGKEKARSSSKQELAPATTKSSKASSSKHAKPDNDDNGDVSEKVSSRKKKRTDSPKEKTIRSAKQEKDTGKKVGKDKTKQETQQPGKEELRKKICEILKEVDFNTATFTDILKRLATNYKADLTPRKASIKLMIQEELTKLAEAEEDDDDDEDEEPNPENVQVKKQKVA